MKDDGETVRAMFLTLIYDMAFDADCEIRARAADPIMAREGRDRLGNRPIDLRTQSWLDSRKHLSGEAFIGRCS